jgi:uncharacterized Fe-S cluster protein YjdI/CDGSH-type Zn-finger protein
VISPPEDYDLDNATDSLSACTLKDTSAKQEVQVTRRAYRGSEIEVSFDLDVCIHATECVRGLPAVFDRDRRPWILPDGATADEVARVIDLCPSGALQYERLSGTAGAQRSATVTVTPLENGPVVIQGEFVLQHEDGTEQTLRKAALCRCGHSNKKPFCDSSHREYAFQAAGTSITDAAPAPQRTDGSA